MLTVPFILPVISQSFEEKTYSAEQVLLGSTAPESALRCVCVCVCVCVCICLSHCLCLYVSLYHYSLFAGGGRNARQRSGGC